MDCDIEGSQELWEF